jgi:hypothetical protein
MTGKKWTLAALAVALVGALATVGPVQSALPTASADVSTRPAAVEHVCSDRDVARTFGGDGVAGCRAYLDACLGELSAHERAEWDHSVNTCLSSDRSFHRCYAEVPSC